MDQSARDIMIKARSELVLEHPFFACLALRLEFREDAGCHSAWTDGRVVGYNPAFIRALPLAKVKGVLCHEVTHLACLHHTRRKGRDKKVWNKACDYAINPILAQAGIDLPAGYLEAPEYAGKSADAIYASLVNRNEDAWEGIDTGANDAVQEVSTQDGAGGGSEGGRDDTQETPAGAQNGEDAPRTMTEAAGAAAESDDAEESPDATEGGDDPGMTGEIRDFSGDAEGGDGDATSLEEESWNAALAQALSKSREAGTLPAALERLVSEMCAPVLGGKEILRRFLEDTARNDFSWTRPNRRYLHAGLYLPGHMSQELAEVAVAVDVSGSIGQAELDSFAAELSALLEEFDASVTVFTCDAAVSSEQRLNRWDLPLQFAAKGGGGTSFRPPFERLEEEGVSPACMIYFTDLQSNSFPEEPAYPVLWVSPSILATASDALPPFGEVVAMEAR